MDEPLSKRKCKPCQGGEDPLKGADIESLRSRLPDGWQVVDEHHLIKEFKFDDFRQALDFTNRVGEVAEAEQHHPDLYLTWGKVEVKIWTHKIGGLSENDFIFAAKADEAL